MNYVRSVRLVFGALMLASAVSCQGALKGPAGPQTTAGEPSAEGPAAAAASLTAAQPLRAEGVDHLSMTLRLVLDITGIGQDTVEFKGTVGLHLSGPTDSEDRKVVGDIIAMSLRGVSPLFGRMVAFESPIQHSRCEFEPAESGQFTGHLDITGWFWLPEHDLFLFGARAIRISGTARGIPLVNLEGNAQSQKIALFDFRQPAARSVGTLAGASARFHDLVRIESYLKTIGTTVPALGRSQRKPR